MFSALRKSLAEVVLTGATVTGVASTPGHRRGSFGSGALCGRTALSTEPISSGPATTASRWKGIPTRIWTAGTMLTTQFVVPQQIIRVRDSLTVAWLAWGVVGVAWGITYELIHLGGEWEPLVFTALRFTVAALILLAFTPLLDRRRLVSSQGLGRLVAAGVLMFVTGNGFVVCGTPRRMRVPVDEHSTERIHPMTSQPSHSHQHHHIRARRPPRHPSTRRRSGLVLLGLIVALGTPSLAWGSSQDEPTGIEASKQDRQRYLGLAQLFTPRDTSTLDLLAGPVEQLTFDPSNEVTCEYHTPGMRLGGATAKFLCRIGNAIYKVKYLPSAVYGTASGTHRTGDREIYGELAATRLFWALGFGADRVFLARVRCHGCPASPHDGPNEQEQRTGAYRRSVRPIGVAAIEQRVEGTTIDAAGDEGWTWSELHTLAGRFGASTASAAPATGQGWSPATREQVEALQLLQVFVQHGDCKPEQQRLVCLPGGVVPHTPGAAARAGRDASSQDANVEVEGDGPAYECRSPFALIDDLGATFGGAGKFTGSGAKMSLSHWAKKPVFDEDAYSHTGGVCRGVLAPSASCSGGVGNPAITEAGRQFLLNRLQQLSDAQIHDLFVAARVTDFCDDPAKCGVEAWVAVFKDKVRQIAAHPCRGPASEGTRF
jgi:hypothetical protein